MSRSTIVKHELTVGLFIAVALAVGGVGFAIKSREKGLLDTRNYTFTVPDGAGLQAGSPVLMQGIQIGSIRDITLTPDNDVRVTCSIVPRYARNLRTDAKATVVEPPVIGNTKVELTPGDASALASPGQELGTLDQPGLFEKVKELQTKVEDVIDKVDTFMARANETMDAVDSITNKIDAGEGLAAMLLNDPQLAQDTRDAVASVSSILHDIDQGDGPIAMAIHDEELAADVRDTIADVGEVVDEVKEGNGSLGRLLTDPQLVDEATGLIQDARGAIAILEELNGEAKVSVRKVQDLLDNANNVVSSVDGLIQSAARTTEALGETVEKVNSGEGNIARLLNDDALYRETKSLLKELRESVEDLREQAPINSFLGVVFSAF